MSLSTRSSSLTLSLLRRIKREHILGRSGTFQYWTTAEDKERKSIEKVKSRKGKERKKENKRTKHMEVYCCYLFTTGRWLSWLENDEEKQTNRIKNAVMSTETKDKKRNTRAHARTHTRNKSHGWRGTIGKNRWYQFGDGNRTSWFMRWGRRKGIGLLR